MKPQITLSTARIAAWVRVGTRPRLPVTAGLTAAHTTKLPSHRKAWDDRLYYVVATIEIFQTPPDGCALLGVFFSFDGPVFAVIVSNRAAPGTINIIEEIGAHIYARLNDMP
jgi:hypothetical protein